MLNDKTSIDQKPDTQKVTMVYPSKKGKRIALFFCDLIICFLFSFLLFTAASYPLGKLATNYNGKQEEMNAAMTKRDSVLENNNLLHYQNKSDDFDTKLNKTFEDYLRYYTYLDSSRNNDVFYVYYSNIYGDKNVYYETFSSLDKDYQFFKIDKSQDAVTLNDTYRTEFKPFFEKGDTPSEQAKKDYQKVQDKIFAQFYSKMLKDIMEKKDISYLDASGNTVSYREQQKIVSLTIKYTYLLSTVTAYIAFILSWAICYVLIPLLHPNRKTLSLFFLSLERVDKNTLMRKTRLSIIPNMFYNLASNMVCILFIPLGVVAFNELFALPALWPVALVSLAFILISFIYMMFDEFNRPLSDVLTKSVVISNDDFDEVCRQKGYLKDGK